MKISEFILRDSTDQQFDDLIEFEKSIEFEKIMKVINDKKAELPGEYTNEDIYMAIDSLNIPYKLTYIGNLEIIEY